MNDDIRGCIERLRIHVIDRRPLAKVEYDFGPSKPNLFLDVAAVVRQVTALENAIDTLVKCGVLKEAAVRSSLDAALWELRKRLFDLESRACNADKLAHEVALALRAMTHNSRSRVSDALLNYMCVGGPGGPESVFEWMKQYSQRAKCDGTTGTD